MKERQLANTEGDSDFCGHRRSDACEPRLIEDCILLRLLKSKDHLAPLDCARDNESSAAEDLRHAKLELIYGFHCRLAHVRISQS